MSRPVLTRTVRPQNIYPHLQTAKLNLIGSFCGVKKKELYTHPEVYCSSLKTWKITLLSGRKSVTANIPPGSTSAWPYNEPDNLLQMYEDADTAEFIRNGRTKKRKRTLSEDDDLDAVLSDDEENMDIEELLETEGYSRDVSRKRHANFLRLKKDGGNLEEQHQDDNPEVDSIETDKKVYTKISGASHFI
jgi:hypothetical protein